MKKMNIEMWTIAIVLGYALLLTAVYQIKDWERRKEMQYMYDIFTAQKEKEFSEKLADVKKKVMQGYINEYHLDSLFDKYKVKNRDVVKAQIILETGDLGSSVYRWSCNMFGMKYAYVRPTTALDKLPRTGYAVYESSESSVIDYALYQARIRQHDMDDEEYIKLLREVKYSEDEKYSSKLREIMKQRQKQKENES